MLYKLTESFRERRRGMDREDKMFALECLGLLIALVALCYGTMFIFKILGGM